MTNKPLSASRRLAQRRVTDVMVFASDGREIRKCRLRDIGVDGAFIEIENFTLAKGTHVEIVPKIRRGGKPILCYLPAKVVRAERGGAAVVFGDLDEHAYYILLGIVKPFKHEPAARPKIGGCE